MVAVSVVPAPVSLEASDAAPFALTAATGVAGDPAASAELAALVTARTGIALGSGDGIRLRVVPGRPAESYRLRADADGVVIEGADAAGLFYGVQTLSQLLSPAPGGWSIPAVAVDDAPRFAYRGVMLDVARHFHPVATVRAVIDRAAALKLNHLHLHLTDDQGWRLALRSRPLLAERASGSSVGGDAGGHYSREDYADIVAYAASRHMVVVPEIDMPGHTHAVGLAYPELVEDAVTTDEMRENEWPAPATGEPYGGVAVGFSSLRIGDEATYDFVADVLGELAGLTPGPYLHVGGDEAQGTSAEDYSTFLARATEIVHDLGKVPIAWHEAGAAPDICDETIGQYWGFVSPTDGADDVARRFVAMGSRLILSPADAVYLDMKPTDGFDIGLTWADGPTSVESAYAWEPTAVVAGLGDDDVLGVEAPLWSETVRDLADIDRLAFPRVAAAAEIAWSPAEGPERTWASFRTRVGALAPVWTAAGIGFDRSEEIPWTDPA